MIFHSKFFSCLILFLLTLVPLTATLSDYGITSDEPIYQEAAWKIQKWLSLESNKIFNQNEINRYWKTDTRRNVHPSGVKWLYLTAQKLIFWENDPYRQNAVLNVLIFSISLTIFLKWWAGDLFIRCVIYIFILLTIPRFFAHVHFPATDIPMTSLLLLLVVSIERTIFQKFFWISGVILGIFASIKITSLLIALPVLALTLIWHRHGWKRVSIRIALICLSGLFIFYLLNPDYWFSPLSRSREFIAQSLTRRSWTPFTVFFNGQFYDYRGPFYYPFTMFFITTPLLHILLLFIGIAIFATQKTLRNDFKMVLIFTCLIFPFIILALPISPAHDGIRYLLPAFPFAACFMALGIEKLWNFVRDQSHIRPLKKAIQWAIAAIALFIFAGDIHSPARIPPFELSYYNRIVGGISGAFRRGYETTYWWEIINNYVLERLNKLCGTSYVYFPLPPTDFFFKHMVDAKEINFKPTQDIKKANFMLIFGRPNVNYWKVNTWPVFYQTKKLPIKIWDISLDSVPLIQLYSIQNMIIP